MSDETVDQTTGEVLPAVIEQGPPPTEPAKANVMPVTGFAKLADAIAAITQEVAENPIHKSGKNSFHNYSYARMQDILGGLTPLMSKHGVVIMQTEVERGFMDKGNAIYATYDFTILHRSGEVWPFPQRQTGVSNTRTSKGTFDDKGLNKCHTSARKYFLLSLFQIPTTDEEDGDRGDNDYSSRRIEVTPKTTQKTEAPKQEPAQKAMPYEIPRPQGIKAVEWGRVLVEQFKLCSTAQEIDDWLFANDLPLHELETKAPQVHDRVMAAEKARREELGRAAA